MRNLGEKVFDDYYTYPLSTLKHDTMFGRYKSHVKNGNFLNINKLPFMEKFADYAFKNVNITTKNLSLVNKDKFYKIVEVDSSKFCLQWKDKYIFNFEFKLLPYKKLLNMSPSEIVKKITKSLGLKKEPTIFLSPTKCGFGVLLRISSKLWHNLKNKKKALILENRKGKSSRSWDAEKCIFFSGSLSIKFEDDLYFSMPSFKSYVDYIMCSDVTFLNFNPKAPLLTKENLKKNFLKKLEVPICKGFIINKRSKNYNKPCYFKAKFGGYCGHHKKKTIVL